MDIGMLGVNCRSSPLELREFFAKAAQALFEKGSLVPFVLLSTCNRTEIYFSGNNLGEIHSAFLQELRVTSGSEENVYSCFGRTCFAHLAKVTAGVDSVLFGEAEIQGQVKKAYELSCHLGSLPSSIHYLFQKSLKIGKQIRTEFSLPKGSVSLESILWDLAGYFFPEKEEASIMLLGYSEINRKILSFFQNKGAKSLYLASRNYSAGKEAQAKYGVHLISWEEIRSWPNFDIVIGGSKSSDYLLFPSQIPNDDKLIKTRLLVDLSLPRNIDPAIEKSPLITLFNIEEIGDFIDRKQKICLLEQKKIQERIEEGVSRQVDLYATRKNSLCV
jgi:glutamyl-tRNA reductase